MANKKIVAESGIKLKKSTNEKKRFLEKTAATTALGLGLSLSSFES
jgi:hypothetical protein